MNRRSTQLDMRENTASSRRHASRRAVGSYSNAICIEEEHPATLLLSPETNAPTTAIDDAPNAASEHAATGDERRDESHLLTVREVAQLLQVPVSWVYEQTRRRCADRIPGFRLGKYWRFTEDDVTAWLAAKRTKDYHHARESQ